MTFATNFYRSFGKRILDCCVVLTLLILLSPALLLLCLSLWLTTGKPIFFVQERSGKGGQPFKLLKFRTMNSERAADGTLLPDKDRITRIGSMLRRTSLDELPELWNILVGDMSLVGPRPLHTRYLARYNAIQASRHIVRPGLTGKAQVSGRNTTSWEERLNHDIDYVNNYGLRLDIAILIQTVAVVLSQRGATTPDTATMPEFLGDEKISA